MAWRTFHTLNASFLSPHQTHNRTLYQAKETLSNVVPDAVKDAAGSAKESIERQTDAVVGGSSVDQAKGRATAALSEQEVTGNPDGHPMEHPVRGPSS